MVDGEHLVIADDADAFARGCVRVLRDDALRTRLIAGARALWNERFRWDEIRPLVGGLARRVGAAAPGQDAADPPTAG